MGDGPVNYNGLAAYHHNTASQPPQNQSAYGFTPMSAQQQPPHLPAPMQGGSGPTNGTQQAPQAASGPPSISLVEGNRKFRCVSQNWQKENNIYSYKLQSSGGSATNESTHVRFWRQGKIHRSYD